MKGRIVVRRAEDGTYWAEVPEVPGYIARATTVADLMVHICHAREACQVAQKITGETGPR